MTTIAKPVTKIIKLTLNGFHGFESHNVRATFTPREEVATGGYPYEQNQHAFDESVPAFILNWFPDEEDQHAFDVTISESAARKFSCRGGCTCGEGINTEFGCDQIDFDTASIELIGNYPQR